MASRRSQHSEGVLHPSTLPVLAQLRAHGVSVVVYGSQGVAVHLGRFKDPGDLDLLVDDEWLTNRCSELTAIMNNLGFSVADPREHEYRNSAGFDVAFAARSVLERDGVLIPGEDPFVTVQVGGQTLSTLTAAAFRRAYAFSVRDGYRLEKRGKNDARIIALLDEHLAHAERLDS